MQLQGLGHAPLVSLIKLSMVMTCIGDLFVDCVYFSPVKLFVG